MFDRLLAQRIEQRPGALRFLEQISGLEPVLREQIGRNITATVFQILRQVAQDVDHLQALAETLAQREHFAFVQLRPACFEMTLAKPGPEFADATGDEGRVFVQLGGRGEGFGCLGGGIAEAQEVEFLCAADPGEGAAEFPAVVGGLGFEPREAAFELFEEFALAVVFLLGN